MFFGAGDKGVKFSINPFQTSVPSSYLLITSEKLCFSDVFKGYEEGTLA